jgi:adenine-specific DNA-methyltransferase
MKFNEKYNREDFIDFLNGFLPEDVADKKEEILIKKERYKEITQAEVLGYSPSLDLYILEMDHSRENDPRIAIATDAFKILADHWIHRALVIFKNKESENYRLSYLTISLDVNDKNKAIKKYSNARRYSFYLGAKAKIKTPYQQLITKGKVKDIEDLLNRFSVEVVNREFYDEIQKAFDFLIGDGTEEKTQLKLPGMKNGVFAKDFAVRLIGRIMFCWFLKQKKTDSGQLIPEEILSSKSVVSDYYHSTLEPLFFEVLNTSIDTRDIRSEFFDKVPYLNGGLFSPQSGDFYELDHGTFASKHINTLNIADGWFKNLFELLETYNFTIDENTAIDQELSVDPEMLGRIFENLLAKINPETGISDRKKTGSFYTPRPIVEYMVDQSLLEYLKTKTNISEEQLSVLISYDLNDDAEHPLSDEEKEKIVTAVDLLKVLDPACGSGAFPIGMLQKVVHILQTVDPECNLLLAEKLKDVPELYKQKIVNEIHSKEYNYTRKLEVIKNSIFGVDIQPIAVDVSRLRCFLTLVVEAEVDDTKQNRGIDPLPNLDFKFVCANTLIGAPEQHITKESLFGDDFQEKLSVAVDKYFSSSGENKRSANNDIHKLIDRKIDEKLNHLAGLVSYGGDKKIEAILAKNNEEQIKQHSRTLNLWNSYKNIFENKPVDFFETKYFFPSVKEGFDIVVGNPPYVGEKGNKDIFRNIKDSQLGSRFHLGKMDLFYFFFHFGIDVLKSDGTLAFITTNYFITATGAKKLIDDFQKRTTILKMINFNEMKVFESALGQHNMITILQKDKHVFFAKTAITRRVGYLHNNNEIIQDILNFKDAETEYNILKQEDLYDNNSLRLRSNNKTGIDEIINKMLMNSVSLGSVSSINKGFHSGCDKVSDSNKKKVKSSNFKTGQGIFVVSKKEFFEKGLEKQISHNCYKSSDINKYYTHEISNPNLIVIYTNKNTEIDKFPATKEHLSGFREFLEMKREYKNGRLPWFSQHWPRDENIFTDKEKIILPYRPKENIFSLCDFDFYASEDVLYIRPLKDTFTTKYILGLLNSKLMYHWLFNRGKRKGNTLELYQDPLSKIPIPKIGSSEKKVLANKIESLIGEIILEKKKDIHTDTKNLELQVDEFVMDLYGLNEEEKEIIRKS